jgi:hypothetical protein
MNVYKIESVCVFAHMSCVFMHIRVLQRVFCAHFLGRLCPQIDSTEQPDPAAVIHYKGALSRHKCRLQGRGAVSLRHTTHALAEPS